MHTGARARKQKYISRWGGGGGEATSHTSTSFPGFSPTRPYGARERETLVGSGHVVPEQN